MDYEIDDDKLDSLEQSTVESCSTSEVMDVLIGRLVATNGIEFCSKPQLLALLNLIEGSAY